MGESEEGEKKKKKKKREGWNGGQPGGVMCDLCMAGAWHNVLLLIILRSLSRVNDAEGSVLRRWNETRGLYTHLCSTLVYSSHSMLVTGLCTLSRVLHIELY